MNFNKNLLAALISSTLIVGAAHAAMSLPTPKVVGHLPTITFIGTKPIPELGNTLTFTAADFNFSDEDLDTEGTHTYMWQLNDIDTGNTTLSYPLNLAATADIGKNLKLVVIPKTTTGDPKEGKALIIDFGSIAANATATPSISALTMAGTLQLGQNLSATYLFAANGGDPMDKSTYAWGRVGTTATAAQTNNTSVSKGGTVDNYALTAADIGQVVELSVQAKNGAGVTGNTQTISSNGLTGGGSTGEVVDPAQFDIRIKHGTSATELLNGPDFSGRPVVGKDLMTAECKYSAAPAGDFAICDTSAGAPYSLQWKHTGDGTSYNNITVGVTGATYMPHTSHQGQQIAVELTTK